MCMCGGICESRISRMSDMPSFCGDRFGISRKIVLLKKLCRHGWKWSLSSWYSYDSATWFSCGWFLSFLRRVWSLMLCAVEIASGATRCNATKSCQAIWQTSGSSLHKLEVTSPPNLQWYFHTCVSVFGTIWPYIMVTADCCQKDSKERCCCQELFISFWAGVCRPEAGKVRLRSKCISNRYIPLSCCRDIHTVHTIINSSAHFQCSLYCPF